MTKTKSLTIHQLDEHMARRIEQEANKRGTSMNRVIKALLAQSLGMKPKPEGVHRATFKEFCGVWSEEETRAFSARTKDLERVDTEDWR